MGYYKRLLGDGRSSSRSLPDPSRYSIISFKRRNQNSSDPALYSGFNDSTKIWTDATAKDLKSSLDRHRIGKSGRLRRSIRGRTYKRGGIIYRIGFKLERYGVYRQKGVGKGRKAGSAKAKAMAVNWFNSVLEDSVPELADIAQAYYADINVNRIFIR